MDHILEFKRGDESLGCIALPNIMLEQAKEEMKESFDDITSFVKKFAPILGHVLKNSLEVTLQEGDVVIINDHDFMAIDTALLEAMQKGIDEQEFKEVQMSEEELSQIDDLCEVAKNLLSGDDDTAVDEFFTKLPIPIRAMVLASIDVVKPEDMPEEQFAPILKESEDYKKYLLGLPFEEVSN